MPYSTAIVSFFVACLLQSFLETSAHAQVRIQGSPTEYPTISAAVGASSPNDVVEIDTGTYYESDITISHPLVIKAVQVNADYPQVRIDASGNGRHFFVQADCTLLGLRLRKGDASGSAIGGGDGGAILHDGGLLTLRDCIIQTSSAQSGGGISTNGSTLDLVRSKIHSCTATARGGAIHMAGSTVQAISLLYLTDCTITDNDAGMDGGGIHMTDSTLNAVRSEVHDNKSSGDGGGVCVLGTGVALMTPVLNMADCAISGNVANGSGGGVHADKATLDLFQVAIEYNRCDGPSGLSLGGGMYIEQTACKSSECSLSFNESSGSGGGVALVRDFDFNMPQHLVSEFESCIFQQNVAGLTGGGLEIRLSGVPVIKGCQIFDNMASNGGGAFHLVRLQPGSNPMPDIMDTFICSNSALQIFWNLGSQGFNDLGGNTILENCAPPYAGGDIPDPNPVQNEDGTYTWYAGNNTQYPVIQEVIDACDPGDEIVIMAGEYVESLSLDKPDITIRPATTPGGQGPEAGFQKVVFWNPTEGFENDNGHAFLLGPNTSNTVVGRPREFTQLANGSIVPTRLPFGGGMARSEFDPEAVFLPMCNIAYTNLDSMTRTQRGLAGYLGDELAIEFWSRSIDDYAVRTMNSLASVSHCKITSQNGFGGGLFVEGDDDATSFVNCNVVDTYSGGVTNDGHPVHAVLIHGGNPSFSGCSVARNTAGVGGIIHQSGGTGVWSGSVIGGYRYDDMNNAPVSDGIYVMVDGAAPSFHGCTFRCNLSRFGTVYFDSSDNQDHEFVLFSETAFLENMTVSSQYGAVAWCVDELPGRSPLVVFDLCRWFNDLNDQGTESGSLRWEKDVHSNYFPSYRILRDLSSSRLKANASPYGAGASDGTMTADLNGDGVVDGVDLTILLATWGG